MKFTGDLKLACVTDLASSALVLLDTITGSVITAVQLDGHQEAVALSADGELLYVADYWGGTLTSRSRRSCAVRKRRESAPFAGGGRRPGRRKRPSCCPGEFVTCARDRRWLSLWRPRRARSSPRL